MFRRSRSCYVRRPSLLLAALLLSVCSLAAQQPWIHVEVTEKAESGAHVKINLPLSLASVAASMVPNQILAEVREELEKEGFSQMDLKALWAEVKAAGEAEFVTVESEDSRVQVGRKGDLLQVRVRDADDSESEFVEVDIPIDAVDALLSGDAGTLDLAAAIERLKDRRGDIIRVRDDDSNVRIWIDVRS